MPTSNVRIPVLYGRGLLWYCREWVYYGVVGKVYPTGLCCTERVSSSGVFQGMGILRYRLVGKGYTALS